ncbi:MAG: S-layer homology domain-containing protein, partial [Firmicutes bacterium]|nr:S-layer homology domain-containing protein [Bacillota bacterium]
RHEGSYYVAAVDWKPETDHPYVLPNVEYSITVTVETEVNHEFTGDVKAYVNGYPATIIYRGPEQLKFMYTFPALTPVPPSMVFYDVSVDDWFFGAVEYVYYNNLMNGVGDNLFDPQGVTSRAMVVTVLYRMEGSPSVSGSLSFADVPLNEWYTDAVKWAASKGIVTGYDLTSFGPNDPVTREQLACIFMRYAQFKGTYDENDHAMLAGFNDRNEISSWAENAASWAFGVGLINGIEEYDGLYFCPQDDATRAQFAAILQRYCE